MYWRELAEVQQQMLFLIFFFFAHPPAPHPLGQQSLSVVYFNLVSPSCKLHVNQGAVVGSGAVTSHSGCDAQFWGVRSLRTEFPRQCPPGKNPGEKRTSMNGSPLSAPGFKDRCRLDFFFFFFFDNVLFDFILKFCLLIVTGGNVGPCD